MSRITTVPVSAYPLTCLYLSVDISLQLTRRVPWSSRIESSQEMKNKKEISLRFVVFLVDLFQQNEVFPTWPRFLYCHKKNGILLVF